MKQLISIQEACRITSLSRTTLWKKIKNEQFPKPVRLNCDRKAFLASEIEEWIDGCIADRDALPGR